MTFSRSFSLLAATLLTAVPAAAADDPQEILRKIDAQLSFASDYKSVAKVRERRADGTEQALELVIYRRDRTSDLLFLVKRPSSMAGSGFLRIGENLWEYSVVAGQWERRTRRADIVGTLLCESDFDRSRLSVDYDGVEEKPEVIKGETYRKFLLKAKPGVELTFDSLRIWVDKDLKIVKRIGYAPSGKPLRTDIIRSYQKVRDPISGREVLHMRDVIERQEEQGVTNSLRYDDIVLSPLPENLFTKTWFEGQLSR
ncbi:MAG: outer membrane lipoprotein-sorting protein [Myxococcaceae bacterium]